MSKRTTIFCRRHRFSGPTNEGCFYCKAETPTAHLEVGELLPDNTDWDDSAEYVESVNATQEYAGA